MATLVIRYEGDAWVEIEAFGPATIAEAVSDIVSGVYSHSPAGRRVIGVEIRDL